VVRDGMQSRRSRRGCLVRVGAGVWSRHSVELASYETDLVMRFEVGCVLLRLSRFVFLSSIDVGTPILLVPTVTPEPLGECEITLPEVCLVSELES
jgi:hypothetical protein